MTFQEDASFQFSEITLEPLPGVLKFSGNFIENFPEY